MTDDQTDCNTKQIQCWTGVEFRFWWRNNSTQSDNIKEADEMVVKFLSVCKNPCCAYKPTQALYMQRSLLSTARGFFPPTVQGTFLLLVCTVRCVVERKGTVGVCMQWREATAWYLHDWQRARSSRASKAHQISALHSSHWTDFLADC